jgi:hypothetical protein
MRDMGIETVLFCSSKRAVLSKTSYL